MADMKKTLELMTQTLSANGLTRVAVKLEDFEIEIEKKAPPVVTSVNRIDETVAIPAPIPDLITPKKLSGNVVKAPIIGTFYESSAPGKPPFVKVGDSVKRDDVLFIIESMKLMNEVTSEFDGVVKEIFVKNADALEFDQPVMVIE
jgi:acetyl-CoA carboxylase biotin carboxyl carrier protein